MLVVVVVAWCGCLVWCWFLLLVVVSVGWRVVVVVRVRWFAGVRVGLVYCQSVLCVCAFLCVRVACWCW